MLVAADINTDESSKTDDEELPSGEDSKPSKRSPAYDPKESSKQTKKIRESLDFKPIFQPIENVPLEDLFTPEEVEAKRLQEELIATGQNKLDNENEVTVADLRWEILMSVGAFIILGTIVVFRILSDWKRR